MAVIIIGTITIDSIRFVSEENKIERVGLRYGGVCNNVACALGNIGFAPTFISTKYFGELGASVNTHLENNRVMWQPIENYAGLPFYQADIDPQGNVVQESFIDTSALNLLTASVLQEKLQEFSHARIIVTCTDLDSSSLLSIQRRALALGAEFWLLSSSALEVSKFRSVSQANVIGMNISELSSLTKDKMTSYDQITRKAIELVSDHGACLVTLGSRGSLLCLRNSGKPEAFYQSVPPIVGKSPVAAGDILFACLLGNRLKGLSWEEALNRATAATVAFISEAVELSPYSSLANPSLSLDAPKQVFP